jgi:hypothetical protein
VDRPGTTKSAQFFRSQAYGLANQVSKPRKGFRTSDSRTAPGTVEPNSLAHGQKHPHAMFPSEPEPAQESPARSNRVRAFVGENDTR